MRKRRLRDKNFSLVYVLRHGILSCQSGKRRICVWRTSVAGMRLHLADGKTFTIKAEGLSEANKYVKSITLNGEPYTKNFISHADIVKGGTLVYQMTDKK